ncbi:Uncharacterised protein [Orientia tsutsugamushi]|nr:Uncharacterised protein [Orientia tsutsugamushi]
MYESLSDNRKLLSIWNRQKCKYPSYKQHITLAIDWGIYIMLFQSLKMVIIGALI